MMIKLETGEELNPHLLVEQVIDFESRLNNNNIPFSRSLADSILGFHVDKYVIYPVIQRKGFNLYLDSMRIYNCVTVEEVMELLSES